MRISRADVDAATDIKIEDVEVPEWGGVVGVKMMTAEERDNFESTLYNEGKQDLNNIRAKLVVRTLVDDEGKRLYKDSEAVVLAQKSAKALDRIFKIAQKLNGIGQDAVAELEKN